MMEHNANKTLEARERAEVLSVRMSQDRKKKPDRMDRLFNEIHNRKQTFSSPGPRNFKVKPNQSLM